MHGTLALSSKPGAAFGLSAASSSSSSPVSPICGGGGGGGGSGTSSGSPQPPPVGAVVVEAPSHFQMVGGGAMVPLVEVAGWGRHPVVHRRRRRWRRNWPTCDRELEEVGVTFSSGAGSGLAMASLASVSSRWKVPLEKVMESHAVDEAREEHDTFVLQNAAVVVPHCSHDTGQGLWGTSSGPLWHTVVHDGAGVEGPSLAAWSLMRSISKLFF